MGKAIFCVITNYILTSFYKKQLVNISLQQRHIVLEEMKVKLKVFLSVKINAFL